MSQVAVTASQRRHLFEEMVGATTDRNLWRSLDAVINAVCNERDAKTDQQVAELCRHFSSLELVMRIVWEEHIQRGELAPSCGSCGPASAVVQD